MHAGTQTEESAANRMVLAIVSTFVVLLGVIILTVIIAAFIAGVCVWHGRQTRGTRHFPIFLFF